MKVKIQLTAAQKRLFMAVAAGLVAAVLLFQYIGSLEARANQARSSALSEYGGARTEVLVALRDLQVGEELNASNTTMMPWLSDLLPQGALTSTEAAWGKTLAVPVYANEPLLAVKLGLADTGLIRVPDGLTALSVPLSDDRAVGGSLVAGSAVDVYAVGAAQVRLVASDVLVLGASNSRGVAQNADTAQAGVVLGSETRTALKWVTLAVSDEHVAELLAAARDNKLSLVLPGQNAGASLMAITRPHEVENEATTQAGTDSATGTSTTGTSTTGTGTTGTSAIGATEGQQP